MDKSARPAKNSMIRKLSFCQDTALNPKRFPHIKKHNPLAWNRLITNNRSTSKDQKKAGTYLLLFTRLRIPKAECENANSIRDKKMASMLRQYASQIRAYCFFLTFEYVVIYRLCNLTFIHLLLEFEGLLGIALS